MFGGDYYRGNTTPMQRLRWAKENLEIAEAREREARRKFEEASSELAAFASRLANTREARKE